MAIYRMNLLYISLAEVLVFSDASVFSENQPNSATGRGWSEYVLYWWSAYELMAEGINWMFLKWNRDRTVPSTGQYTLDEFVAKLKDYAEKLASSISKSENSYQERFMSQTEQEAYVAESLNRALDEMEAHKKNGTKPMSFDDFMAKLDERPRKKLNFSTPKECFYKNIS